MHGLPLGLHGMHLVMSKAHLGISYLDALAGSSQGILVVLHSAIALMIAVGHDGVSNLSTEISFVSS